MRGGARAIVTSRSNALDMDVMRRLLIDDRGQDLVEYVLLGATIAFASLTAMTAFPGIINSIYVGWDNATQGLWYPADPTP